MRLRWACGILSLVLAAIGGGIVIVLTETLAEPPNHVSAGITALGWLNIGMFLGAFVLLWLALEKTK